MPGDFGNMAGGDPMFFDGSLLYAEAGVVGAADATDDISMVVPAEDIDDAYRAN